MQQEINPRVLVAVVVVVVLILALLGWHYFAPSSQQVDPAVAQRIKREKGQ